MDSSLEVLRQADEFLRGEQAEQAMALLTKFLLEHDNPAVWMKLARAYQILGEEVVAIAILRNAVLKVRKPHIKDIIAARIPYSKPLVVDDVRLVYFNVPKCGSSSIKDAILLAAGRELKREAVHFHVSEYERVLSFDSIDHDFADYTSIAVFRHPARRLRSYWSKNISESKSLAGEARGRTSYYGLSTEPSYDMILRNFHRYRQVFADFRHHTDSIVGYVGRKRDRVKHVFDIAETDGALRLIGELHGISVPPIQNMKSSGASNAPADEYEELETAVVSSFYREELALFYSTEL